MKWITEVMKDNARREQKEFIKNYNKHIMDNTIPRRIRIDLYSDGEKAIHDARQVIENMGADALLTEAVILLNQAQEKVADYIDAQYKRL